MNQLSIDADGRVVFSSKDEVPDEQMQKRQQAVQSSARRRSAGNDDQMDTGDVSELPGDSNGEEDDEPDVDGEVDINRLGELFFSDMGLLDSLDICPTFKDFSIGETDTKLALPLMNLDNWRDLRSGRWRQL